MRKTIRQRYRDAEGFVKPTVLQAWLGHGWIVVGPGLKWRGDYPTWDEAIKAALNGR